MENINPREILKNLFLSFKDYPPNKFKIVVSTDEAYMYYISMDKGKFSVNQITIDENEQDVVIKLPGIENVNEFFSILKNQKITDIAVENYPIRRQRPISINIFSCQQAYCYDQRYKNLKSDLASSEIIAKVTGNPEFLKNEGYFNVHEFGRTRSLDGKFASVKKDIIYLNSI